MVLFYCIKSIEVAMHFLVGRPILLHFTETQNMKNKILVLQPVVECILIFSFAVFGENPRYCYSLDVVVIIIMVQKL